MSDNKKICSCGNPQSYPIPHEHDQTDREKQIILAFEVRWLRLRQAIFRAAAETPPEFPPWCNRADYGYRRALLDTTGIMNKVEREKNP